MGMNLDRVGLEAVASGSVAGATGAGTNLQGVATARTGAGVYTLTLGDEVDATNLVALMQSKTALLISSLANTSDSVKTVTWQTVAAGNANTDCDFDFVIFRRTAL